MKRFFVLVTLFLMAFTLDARAQRVGPENGSLVIVGGGSTADTGIVEAFIDMSGGPDALIVLIPTAGGGDKYGQDWGGRRLFEAAGATNLFVLHTNDRKEADMDTFVDPIRNAGGVWFGGGRQWRLADSYLNTLVHEELWALLERDGVIGGTSAGATIQGSYLARGDSKTNTVMMGDHEEGLAFLKDVAIDQHLLKQNRQFDMLEIIRARPELLGIGIDESTALIVNGDMFSIMGKGYVAIYDVNKTIDSGGDFYLMTPGDEFDLATRSPFRVGNRRAPLGRVVDRDNR
jgi:cyanophycinase